MKQNPSQRDDTGAAEVINAGSGGASKVRHVPQSAYGEVDLISM